MTPLAQCIVDEAITWIDTPFHANARAKGVGADCVGVIMATYETCGIDLQYRNNYSVRPDGTLRREIGQRFDRVRDKSLLPGDVLLMAFMHEEPHHVALYLGDGTIVHSYAQARRCVRQKLDAYWRSATRGVYRHPALLA